MSEVLDEELLLFLDAELDEPMPCENTVLCGRLAHYYVHCLRHDGVVALCQRSVDRVTSNPDFKCLICPGCGPRLSFDSFIVVGLVE